MGGTITIILTIVHKGHLYKDRHGIVENSSYY